MSSQTTDTNIMNIHGDSPINNLREDRFGRASLVEHVAKAIQKKCESEHESLCIGIYGKWGEGKTSFVNMLKNQLRESENMSNVPIADFNPWIINDEQSLIKEFFKLIVGNAEGDLKNFIGKYGGIISYSSKFLVNLIAPGLGNVVKGQLDELKDHILEAAETPLDKQKENISKELVKSNIHLLVFVDDIDRLDREEMHAVFRLVRQVADFKNTIYVLSLDEERVSKSIGKYYGDGGENNGRQFLEKIVQIPIVLPQIPRDALKDILYYSLIDVFKSCSLNGEETVQAILDRVFPLFETKREIVRYINQLQFFFPAVQTEVNHCDYCILEAIKTLNHKAYNLIRNNRFCILKELPITYKPEIDAKDSYEVARTNYDNFVKQLAAEFPLSKQETVKEIMTYYLSDSSNNKSHHKRTKRLCSDIYFDRYFLQSTPNEFIADRLVDTLDCDSIAKIQQWIQDHLNYNDKEIARALFDMADRKNISSCQQANLCAALCMSSLGESKNFAKIASELLKEAFRSLSDIDYSRSVNMIFANANLNACLFLLAYINDADRKRIAREAFIVLRSRVMEQSALGIFNYPRLINEPFCDLWQKFDREDFIKGIAQAFQQPSFEVDRFWRDYLPNYDLDERIMELYNVVRLFGSKLWTLIDKTKVFMGYRNKDSFIQEYEELLERHRNNSEGDALYC